MITPTTLCYIRRDGKTLMMHRIKKENDMHEGKWNGVGGKFEAGETPQECARREIFEETGLITQNPHLKGVISFPNFGKKKQDQLVFVFEVTDATGNIINNCIEGNLEWVDDSELGNLNLWEGDKIFMPWLQEKKFFSAIFTYGENERVTDHNIDWY